MELIVVMALIAVVFAIVAPSLSAFLTGRQLHSEARRLLALTRFARSEAVSAGVAMELWIAPGTGAYGVAPKDGYAAPQARKMDYQLADKLSFDPGSTPLDDQGELRIEFWPDGAIEGPAVTLREERGMALAIQPADVGQGYVIAEAEPSR